jgi:hypothetical protein
MTLDVYASLFENDLDALSDRLDEAISRAPAASARPGIPQHCFQSTVARNKRVADEVK